MAFPISSFAASPCDDFNSFERKNGETWDATVKDVGVKFLDDNTVVVTSKTDLEKSYAWKEKYDPSTTPIAEAKGITYKYTIGKDCRLRVAKDPVIRGLADQARDIHHVRLARGEHAYTAGGLALFVDKRGKKKFIVTNQSTRFCPTVASLDVAKKMFESHGWKHGEDFEIQDATPPPCRTLNAIPPAPK
jgi:hypothetical protein